MTDLQNCPWHELDRHHEQARIALRDALTHADERVYRAAESLEERVRLEKVRRARARSP